MFGEIVYMVVSLLFLSFFTCSILPTKAFDELSSVLIGDNIMDNVRKRKS